MNRILPTRSIRAAAARVVSPLALAALVGGCAVPWAQRPDPSPGTSAAVSPAMRALADEFAGVFARVGGLDPGRVSPRVVTRDDPAFTRALEQALAGAGYRVSPADSASASPVGYAIQSTSDGATYTVGMGDVQVRRSYSGPAHSPVPAGPLYVRGTDVSSLAPIAAAAPAPAAATEGAEAVASEAAAADVAVSDTAVAIARRDGVPVIDGLVSRALERERQVPAGVATVRNVMDVGDSNFADLFVDYRTVDERILVFPNDSTRLGEDNKAIIDAGLERFEPATDMFSVVGCSLGATSIDNGNEVLALGRANRVKEELVSAGVPSRLVVDEGCWAGEASARFPSRGVVLTHRRRDGTLGG